MICFLIEPDILFQRPFICKICSAAFKSQKSVSVHQKIHRAHDYECPVCERTFLTNQLMRNHCVKNHPDYALPPKGTVMNKTWLKKFGHDKQQNVKFVQQFQKVLK